MPEEPAPRTAMFFPCGNRGENRICTCTGKDTEHLVAFLWIEAEVPISAVEEIAFVVFQPWDIWPLPLIENTGAGHEDVANVFDDFFRVEVLGLDVPLGSFLVPPSFHTLVLKLHVLADSILVGNTLPVLQNFRGASVELRPAEIRFEAELVRVRGDIWKKSAKGV